MYNPYAQYLRSMMPFISSAPTPPEAAGTPARPADPRVIDQVVRSFHNRFGRPPTEQELYQSIPHFLPAAMPETAGQLSMIASPFGVSPVPAAGAAQMLDTSAPGFAPQSYGQGHVGYDQVADGLSGEPASPFDSGETSHGQIAFAENLQSSAVVDPGSAQELHISFGKGRYKAWVRVTNQGSWTSQFSPPERRSPLMSGPKQQVDMRFSGEIESIDRMHGRPISFRVANNLSAGSPEVRNLDDGAAIQGPGRVWLHATNYGPHPAEVVLGAYK